MEKSTGDVAKYALVRVASNEDAVKLHQELIVAGFSEISFVKEIPRSFGIDEVLNDVVSLSNGTSTSSRSKPDDMQSNGKSSQDDNGLAASVIAALHSLAQGCLLKEDLDSEQQPSSSSTSHDPSPESQTAIPSPIPFVARPRGSRMQNCDDPTVYASCKLCSNKIMSSRLSNLTNHVRRHAALKQYQCCHCGYSHNEMAKVRLHMQHNHHDFESSPVDGMCKEMQQQWANLMEQCFPGHAKRFAQNNSFVVTAGITNDKITDVKRSVTENSNESESQTKSTEIYGMYNPVSPSESFICNKCGEFVKSAKLMTHLVDAHSADCHSFLCSECNFLANYPWKVVLHIANEHNEKPSENSVVMTPSGTNYIICVPIYFPDFAKRRGYTIEDDILRQDYEKKCARLFQHDLAALKAVQCELCFKLFTADQNISVLLSHARNHFGIKAFSCPECAYKSSDFGIVSAHMERKHPDSLDRPIDTSIEQNRDSWQKLACHCFPDLENSFKEALNRRNDLKRRPTSQHDSSNKKSRHQ